MICQLCEEETPYRKNRKYCPQCQKQYIKDIQRRAYQNWYAKRNINKEFAEKGSYKDITGQERDSSCDSSGFF